MDVGHDHERDCLRVAFAKRGECNPAGLPKRWLWFDCEATKPDVAEEI